MLASRARVPGPVKREVLRLVERTQARTDWTVRRIVKRLGMSRSRDYDWKRREDRDRLDDLVPRARSWPHAILTEEKEAVTEYALAHPRDGYRRLAWMMIDADVAYVSPSSVYRILRDADLL